MSQRLELSNESGALLCNQEDLVEGQALGFDPWRDGRDRVLALRWRGEVRVYLNNCPHLNVPMQYRKNRFMSGDGEHIVCFAHGALFLPQNGFCVLGPCVGQSLQMLEVSTDEQGDLWVKEPEQPSQIGCALDSCR